MVYFPICSARFAAPNLKDQLQFPACLTHGVGGQFCPRGILPLALQWIVRSGRSFLLYRLLLIGSAGKQPSLLDGLTSPA
jgi:hypothetical protein